MKTAIICILSLSVLFSCSSEKQGGHKAKAPESADVNARQDILSAGKDVNRVASIEIKPADATHDSVMNLTTKGLDMAGAKIEWLVNGEAVPGADGTAFRATPAIKGDEVEARVTVQDREIDSNVVKIHDAPPWITRIKIMPEVFKPGDRLRVDAEGKDPDGDDVELKYQWTINGEPAGDGREIDGQIKRGDKVEVRVTPSDGEVDGSAVVLKREIGNIPPMIVEGGKFNFDGTVCTYWVKATDPDGDRLTYSLKGAPSGMTIDKETGRIRWDVPADFAGKASFTAVVKDGHGGESEQKLTFTIKSNNTSKSST